jgi:glycosidase
LDYARLEAELADPRSLRSSVYRRLARLLKARQAYSAFHPYGSQRVLTTDETVFALLRTSPDGVWFALCLHNVTDQPVWVRIDLDDLPFDPSLPLVDLISGKNVSWQPVFSVRLRPYQVAWLGPH